MSLLSLVAIVLILLPCYQEGFMQLLLEMVIIIYYQFPPLPACSLYLSTELQADVTVFGH